MSRFCTLYSLAFIVNQKAVVRYNYTCLLCVMVLHRMALAVLSGGPPPVLLAPPLFGVPPWEADNYHTWDLALELGWVHILTHTEWIGPTPLHPSHRI